MHGDCACKVDVPLLFYDEQTLGGTMNTMAQAEWIGIVVVMAIWTVIAFAALIRGMGRRITAHAI